MNINYENSPTKPSVVWLHKQGDTSSNLPDPISLMCCWRDFSLKQIDKPFQSSLPIVAHGRHFLHCKIKATKMQVVYVDWHCKILQIPAIFLLSLNHIYKWLPCQTAAIEAGNFLTNSKPSFHCTWTLYNLVTKNILRHLECDPDINIHQRTVWSREQHLQTWQTYLQASDLMRLASRHWFG